jgi:NAD dependent epimerase/dehydratase family enzyme
MHSLITGATGLIGREPGKALVARGDTLVCLVRDVSAARRRLPFAAVCHAWNHTRPVPAEALYGVDAVVNLAGEPVADARLPAGWLGALAGGSKVASDVERIFDYRSRKIDERFGA